MAQTSTSVCRSLGSRSTADVACRSEERKLDPPPCRRCACPPPPPPPSSPAGGTGWGHLGIVRLLLAHGIDPFAATPFGRTAYDWASYNNCTLVMDELRKFALHVQLDSS
eukprot:506322-Hanusia_phi.AAC.1